MAKFIDKCCVCGREYTNYDERRAYRPWCSVGCQFSEPEVSEPEDLEE